MNDNQITYRILDKHKDATKGLPIIGSYLCCALEEYYPDNKFSSRIVSEDLMVIDGQGCSFEVSHSRFSFPVGRADYFAKVSIDSSILESRM